MIAYASDTNISESASNIQKKTLNSYKISLGKHDGTFFKSLITKIFENLEDDKSKYFLANKWLFSSFVPLLKSNNIKIELHKIISKFYSSYPFDTVDIISNIYFEFFNELILEEVMAKPENLKIVEKGGMQAIASAYMPLFLEHIKEMTIDKVSDELDKAPNEYEPFYLIIQDALRFKVKTILELSDDDFNWSKYSNLENWINVFDYESMLSENNRNSIDKIIDGLFRKQTLSTEFISQKDFIETKLQPYFDEELNSETRKPLFQFFLYYLFFDLLKNEIHTNNGTLDDVRILIENITQKPFLINYKKLKVFLPKIETILKKFNYYWKTDNSSSGLVIERNIPKPWLTPKDESDDEFEFEFIFKFVIDPIFNINEQPDSLNIFKILVREVTPIIEQGESLVDEYKKKIEWQKGFKNASSWTEKDIVDWVSNINNYEDIINSQEAPDNYKILIQDDWKNFILNFDEFLKLKNEIEKLSNDNNNYNLVVEPVIEFIKKRIINTFFIDENGDLLINDEKQRIDTNDLLGKVKIYLRLTQTLKDVDNPEIINVKKILIKDSTKILNMMELIEEKFTKQFPLGINFNSWKKDGKSFWLNEFLDDDYNPITSLKEKQDLVKRSNWDNIYGYLKPLIREINEYRNDFIIEGPNSEMDEDGIIIKNLIFEPEYGLKFVIYDKKMNNQFINSVTKKLRSMKVIGSLDKGRYKGTNGEYNMFIKKLKNLTTPLHPMKQKTPESETTVSKDFTFKVFNKDSISFDEELKFSVIEEELLSKGYSGTDISDIKVKIKIENDKFKTYIPIKNIRKYHSFFTGKEVTWKSKENNSDVFNLFLHFNGVSAEKIEETYQNIINNRITGNKKGNKILLGKINKVFKILKIFDGTNWRDDVSQLEYDAVVEKVIDIIEKFQPSDVVMAQLKKIYNDKVPKKIVEKLKYVEYIKTFDKILKEKDSFSSKQLKQILEDDKLIDFLNDHEIDKTKDLILSFLKVTKESKYAYLSAGIGLGLAGFLAGATSIRWIKVNDKAKKTSLVFKRNKYISFISLGVAVLSISGSLVLTFLFFLTKGGF